MFEIDGELDPILYLIQNFDSILRDINISLVTNEIELPIPDIRRIRVGKNWIFNKKYWRIVKDHKDDAIISGSLSLIAFGLIDRNPNDVDIILLNKNHNLKLSNNRYRNEDMRENLGTYTKTFYFSHDVNVDVFKSTDKTRYFECEGYKIDHPLDIISHKMGFMKKLFPLYPSLHTERMVKDADDIIKSLKGINASLFSSPLICG